MKPFLLQIIVKWQRFNPNLLSRSVNTSSFQLYWLRLLLLAFIATRALTPVGFMPNALDSGSPFVLCPANAHSAALLAFSENHHGHQNHEEHSSHFADADCPFSAAGISVVIHSDATFAELFLSLSGHERSHKDDLNIIKTFQLPPVRAPPARSIS